jgi:membrane-associated protease RseP (regulator of RpoE activity)
MKKVDTREVFIVLEHEELTDAVTDYLESKMRIDSVNHGLTMTRVIGTLNPPIERTISDIKHYFNNTPYTPIFNMDKDLHSVQYGIFKKAEHKPKYWLHLVLFLATVISTMFVGTFNAGGNPITNPADILLGLPFSLSLMAILTCHELGHYFVSRRAGMITTLPYFIPAPIHFIGTFGALIRMKSLVPDRKTLLRVGMAGPLAGFIVAVPVTIVGVMLSGISRTPVDVGYLHLGDSLLFNFFVNIIHPNIPEGYDLFLHPVALAGWIGFLITSMNLIPIGQLDGGHISYSIFLGKRRYSYYPIIGGLIALGFLWPGWFVWAGLAFFFARRDPVIQDAVTPISTRDTLLAIIPLLILILTFIPIPITLG